MCGQTLKTDITERRVERQREIVAAKQDNNENKMSEQVIEQNTTHTFLVDCFGWIIALFKPI